MEDLVNISASTISNEIPRSLRFNDDYPFGVVAYSAMIFLSAVGNIAVLVALVRNRHRMSGIDVFVLHLAVADLLVAFITMPVEIAWSISVAWKAGDIGCRIVMFIRIFGFYLSSFILIAISLDRLIVIKYPLRFTATGTRRWLMVFICWLLSAIASIPQVGQHSRNLNFSLVVVRFVLTLPI